MKKIPRVHLNLQEEKDMAVTTKNFGVTKDGKQATLFSLTNSNGMVAEITNYGANIVNLLVPDKDGKVADVVLGYDTLEDYFVNSCFFGSTIGPSANRIANASFVVDGVKYQLAVNDGPNNLHSDYELGYHKALWDAVIIDNGVVFSLEDADGNMGFPGNKKIQVTFEITEENELKITYDASSDKNTLINLTNHVYFNLKGHDQGTITDHKLQLLASNYTPVIPGSIPTGEIAPVAGTPFDFTELTTIGDRIENDNEQLHMGLGYDHNWVIDHCDGKVQKVALVEDPVSGRRMEVYTDQPGIQFYAGNCISEHTGKAGAAYGKRTGLALETQAFPNSVNQENFPDVIYGPERDYHTTTIYKFIW